MANYNLDEKGGIFAFGGIKSPMKVMKKGDSAEIKLHSIFNFIKVDIVDLNDTTINFKSKEKTSDKIFTPGDPVIIHFNSGELCVISGDLASVQTSDPLEGTINVGKIIKMKDLKKAEKFSVSLSANVKAIGVADLVPAIAKQVSLTAVKINCKLDILMEDMIDVTIVADKTTKINFKGIVVRKNKLTEGFEYGLEIHEIPESSKRNLHHVINQIVFT